MKIASTFYAQWFDDAPVPAPPGSMVHGVLPAMPRRGRLESPINAAAVAKLLDQGLIDFAHGLRGRANDVLHGTRGKALVQDSFVIISDARLLVERLFSAREGE
jgi:hypothetical protein